MSATGLRSPGRAAPARAASPLRSAIPVSRRSVTPARSDRLGGPPAKQDPWYHTPSSAPWGFAQPRAPRAVQAPAVQAPAVRAPEPSRSEAPRAPAPAAMRSIYGRQTTYVPPPNSGREDDIPPSPDVEEAMRPSETVIQEEIRYEEYRAYYASLTDKQRQRRRAELTQKIMTFASLHPEIRVNTPHPAMPLEQLHTDYNGYAKAVFARTRADVISKGLIMFFYGVEAASYYLKFHMKGYGNAQRQKMPKYYSTLVQIGETQYTVGRGETNPYMALAMILGSQFVLFGATFLATNKNLIANDTMRGIAAQAVEALTSFVEENTCVNGEPEDDEPDLSQFAPDGLPYVPGVDDGPEEPASRAEAPGVMGLVGNVMSMVGLGGGGSAPAPAPQRETSYPPAAPAPRPAPSVAPSAAPSFRPPPRAPSVAASAAPSAAPSFRPTVTA